MTELRHFQRTTALAALICAAPLAAAEYDLDSPVHNYWKRPLTDPFTRFAAEVTAGRATVDTTGDQAFLTSLLAAMKVPASSQMLVFSNTSLQLRFITPSNPRALYFNEDIYIGYIPGGRIEIISIDPAAGAVFHIFDIPRAGAPLRPERSDRCMNCHAREETMNVPGLFIKSVAPIPSGGSLQAFRQGKSGHGIPLAERFGGWYVTGEHRVKEHWGNVLARNSDAGIQKIPLEPGKTFGWEKYPIAASDILPQLIHEHQAGFVNRAIEATYHTRETLAAPGPKNTLPTLDQRARDLTRYILFADEAPLPGVTGDAKFKEDFLRTRRVFSGASLKDFDLKTRMFRFRCSYMIYSAAFTGLPPEMKTRVFREMARALSDTAPAADYAYLPVQEKRAIRAILKATLPGWRE